MLDSGLAARVFPGASVEVGCAERSLWRATIGRFQYEASAPAVTAQTIFDLASLTKVMATGSLAMRLVATGRLNLETPVADLLEGWDGPDRRAIRVRHLLDHSSGLAAHARVWEHGQGRTAFERAIRALPLERAPGTASVYSDLGFILLGFLLADAGAQPLDVQVAKLLQAIAVEPLAYRPPPAWRPRTAPTEFDPWRNRLLVGEVHDENAAALDGVAGHAGLFGTPTAVGAFARVVLRTFGADTALAPSELMRLFATRTGVRGSSRALGWDTMLPTSSCGSRLSPSAIGHTGFTGTSLWIDPARDVYVTLLSNRVYPSRTNDGIRTLRPRLHDAIVEDLEDRLPRGTTAG